MKVIDEADIDSISNGDLSPLKVIFEQNYQYCIYNLAKVAGCSDSDAKDATMDAILVLRNKITSNEYENKNLRSFLLTVALNKYRNKRKRDSIYMEYDPIVLEEYLTSNDANETNDNAKKRVNEIYDTIRTLEEPCKSVLELNLIDGISLDSAYKILGYKSKGVLKTTKSRCMNKLREKLLNYHYE